MRRLALRKVVVVVLEVVGEKPPALIVWMWVWKGEYWLVFQSTLSSPKTRKAQFKCSGLRQAKETKPVYLFMLHTVLLVCTLMTVLFSDLLWKERWISWGRLNKAKKKPVVWLILLSLPQVKTTHGHSERKLEHKNFTASSKQDGHMKNFKLQTTANSLNLRMTAR